MLNLQIITVSTRDERKGPKVTDWFEQQARKHAGFGTDFTIEMIDLAAVNLPLFDEPQHPRLQQYVHEHTKAWSATISRGDAFVFVTPEYNFGTPPSLSNALNYLTKEWAYKAAGFVSYGGVSGGLRGVQMTKAILSSLKVVPIMEAVALPFFLHFIDKETGQFNPGDVNDKAATTMLNELIRWTNALKVLRT